MNAPGEDVPGAGACSDIRLLRERNEDSFLVLHLGTGEAGLRPEARIATLEQPGTVIAVCDGMGGAAAGDLASKLAAIHRASQFRPPAPGIDQMLAEIERGYLDDPSVP